MSRQNKLRNKKLRPVVPNASVQKEAPPADVFFKVVSDDPYADRWYKGKIGVSKYGMDRERSKELSGWPFVVVFADGREDGFLAFELELVGEVKK